MTKIMKMKMMVSTPRRVVKNIVAVAAVFVVAGGPCHPKNPTTTILFAMGQITRQECTDEMDGMVVGDIGNGAIFQPGYVCDGTNLPPIDTVIASPGEPIASEGEVCCPTSSSSSSGSMSDGDGDDGSAMLPGSDSSTVRPEVTREECTGADLNGVIVGDIGDGATRRDDYVCESNGQSPIANIVPEDGQPIATEGEVCCGQQQSSSSSTPTTAPADTTNGGSGATSTSWYRQISVISAGCVLATSLLYFAV